MRVIKHYKLFDVNQVPERQMSESTNDIFPTKINNNSMSQLKAIFQKGTGANFQSEKKAVKKFHLDFESKKLYSESREKECGQDVNDMAIEIKRLQDINLQMNANFIAQQEQIKIDGQDIAQLTANLDEIKQKLARTFLT